MSAVVSALALTTSALVVLTSPQVTANTFAVPAAPVIKKAYLAPNGVRVVFDKVTASPAVNAYVLSTGPGSCAITLPANTSGVVTLPIITGQTTATVSIRAVNAYGFSAAGTWSKTFTATELAGVTSTSWQAVQLLQLSDLHGAIEGTSANAGTALLTTAFAAERAKNPATFTISAGDNIGAAPPISSQFEELPTIESMNLMKFDVSGFGNHEHDRNIAHVQKVIGASDFQWVASNYSTLEPLKSGAKAAKTYHVIDRGGVKVGFVAGNTEDTKEQIFPGNLTFGGKDLVISPDATGINSAIKAAKAEGADFVVAILHQGWQENRDGEAKGRLIDLAKQIKGAAVVFGGHSHQTYSSALAGNNFINGPLIAMTRNAGQEYNRVNVCLDGSRRVRGAMVDVVTRANIATLTPNADGAALVKKYKDQLNAKLDVKIGQVNGIFPQGGTPQVQRAGEAALGNFTTDAMRKKYGTDFAYINGGGIRDKFPAATYVPADKTYNRPGTDKVPPYDVTLGDALAVYPFGNTVGVSVVTGENLWKALENGVSNWPGDGRFPQISGFKFTFDTSKAVGSRVQSVTKLDGTAIAKDAKEYTIAVPDFMIYGGDGYVGVFTPSKAKLRGLLVDVFIEAVQEASAGGKVIQIPALDGRITKVNP
ncbi:MAG: bifunctional metallophosphatase/5'-nucleotidase [Candidatus Nanopelagicaceae bacterium]|nr:bifunctional metallophosphatase/5'-nucleotidase [Candidatus Nanopelagicaceae bacterium]